jgi:GNAT superfamily N-acetyltransferase
MWASERISSAHRVERFHCGKEALDKWLIEAALHADRADTARTWVWSDGDEVQAYFALCPYEVGRDSLPGSLAKSGPQDIPAILLAKLALREDLKGQGHGAQLLVDALSRAVRAIDEAGGRLIVVDAIDDEAHGFYEHYGFKAVPGVSSRLIMRSSVARESLTTLPQ